MKIRIFYPEAGKYKPVFTAPMDAKSIGEVWGLFNLPKFCKENGIPRTIQPGDIIKVEDDVDFPIPKYIGEFDVQITFNHKEIFYYSSLESKNKLQDELIDTYGIVAITEIPYGTPRFAVKPGSYVVTASSFDYYGG